jgi:hypothetical protein
MKKAIPAYYAPTIVSATSPIPRRKRCITAIAPCLSKTQSLAQPLPSRAVGAWPPSQTPKSAYHPSCYLHLLKKLRELRMTIPSTLVFLTRFPHRPQPCFFLLNYSSCVFVYFVPSWLRSFPPPPRHSSVAPPRSHFHPAPSRPTKIYRPKIRNLQHGGFHYTPASQNTAPPYLPPSAHFRPIGPIQKWREYRLK